MFLSLVCTMSFPISLKTTDTKVVILSWWFFVFFILFLSFFVWFWFKRWAPLASPCPRRIFFFLDWNEKISIKTYLPKWGRNKIIKIVSLTLKLNFPQLSKSFSSSHTENIDHQRISDTNRFRMKIRTLWNKKLWFQFFKITFVSFGQ